MIISNLSHSRLILMMVFAMAGFRAQGASAQETLIQGMTDEEAEQVLTVVVQSGDRTALDELLHIRRHRELTDFENEQIQKIIVGAVTTINQARGTFF